MVKITDLLSKADVFGQEIKMTINGDKEHKSACGGVVSLLLMIGLAVYFCIVLFLVPDETTINIETLIVSSLLVWPKIPHTDSDFVEGLGFADGEALDPRYGKF